jgi:hypothetical protein
MTRGLAAAGAALVLTAIGGALVADDSSPTAIAVVSGLALGLVAWAIAVGTDAIGHRLGPAVTGVVQSTVGNLPGFFIVLFALADGEIVVAQTSILGGVFANGLVLLGAAILAGALSSPRGIMQFEPRLPNDTATLLLLTSFVIVLLGLSDTVADSASEHQVEISMVGAACLLGVYVTWLIGYLRTPLEARPRLQRVPVQEPAELLRSRLRSRSSSLRPEQPLSYLDGSWTRSGRQPTASAFLVRSLALGSRASRATRSRTSSASRSREGVSPNSPSRSSRTRSPS